MNDLIDLTLPKDTATIVFRRVRPFLEKHQKEELFGLTHPEIGSRFDLRSLLISCYLQGFADRDNVNNSLIKS